jgi:tRNA nucleotidyltransferase/poly(A) polymerase
LIKAEIDVMSKPFEGELPHAVTVFMDIMDSIAGETGKEWSFVGGFARDRLLGHEPNDFDVASWDNWHFKEKLNEIGCLRIGEQTEPRRKPHDYFMNPYEFSKREHPIHWIEADMEAAFAPTRFDFTINHFAMKSDKRIYAPTYAWKDVAKKVLRISDEAPKSTNVLLRGVRFASKYDFEIDKKTLDVFKERIELHNSGDEKMGNDIVIMNLNKMIDDGVAEKCLKMMKELNFPEVHSSQIKTIDDLVAFHTAKIMNGEAYREPYNGYDEQDN